MAFLLRNHGFGPHHHRRKIVVLQPFGADPGPHFGPFTALHRGLPKRTWLVTAVVVAVIGPADREKAHTPPPRSRDAYVVLIIVHVSGMAVELGKAYPMHT